MSNAWVVQGDLRFLYDGWNLVAELEPVVVTSATSLPAYVRTYTWGKDVTGTEQGAGGVGGLLFVGRYTKDTGTNVLASTLAPMYDGNSNIEGYVKLLVPTASTSAASVEAFKLEYDPFGRELMIAATSPETQATLPPFRFSTKYTDSETDLVYYGHRYYSPELGRWISRDPIEEAGGLNLYGMVGNDPVNRWDYLGMAIKRIYNLTAYDSSFQEFLHDTMMPEDTVRLGNLEHAVKDMKEVCSAKKDCIDNLIIISHGGEGYFSPGGEIISGKMLANQMYPAYAGSTRALMLVRGLAASLCKVATIEIRACNAGKGEDGTRLLQQLYKILGYRRRIILHSNYCYPNGVGGP